MRVLLIGATGTIGRAIGELLERTHEVLRVGCRSGDLRVNLTSKKSINSLLQEAGPCDAVICAAGAGSSGRASAVAQGSLKPGLDTKLMGQVNLVRLAQGFVVDGGSFTLTSGSVAKLPIPGAATLAAVNWAVESFVRKAASQLPRGLRINAVSPVPVQETLQALGMTHAESVPAAKTAAAYLESLEGTESGAVLDVRAFL